MRTDLTLAQVTALKTMLRDQFEEDEQGWLDCLEGETNVFELARKILDRIERDEGDIAALKSQVEDRRIRLSRCGARIDAQRDALMAIMTCAEIDKLPLPEATLSLRTMAASLKVNDPNAVPEEYSVPNPKPDMAKIKEHFKPIDEGLPNWLRVEPERPSLTIRRK